MSNESGKVPDPLLVRDFLKALLDPERFGYSVTEEVRDAARELLGIPKVRKA